MKLSQLITKLKYEITPKEWELLESRDSTIKISEHNRKTLLEMKNTQITKDKEVSTDVINDLKLELETYLNKYMAEDKKKEIAVIEITEEYMKDRLYEFRGKKVMLDSDLAEIYGYETKNFKRQVKNNIAKFEGDDFMFELNDEEVENLSRCKNFTLNMGRGSNIKYKPYVFTEQGVYMLMTVLRGELAIKQSRALVKTFKKMKDYILENRDLIGQREILQLSMEMANNRIEIHKINSDMISLEKQISDVAEGLKDVVTKSELADMMNSFVSDDDERVFLCGASSKDAGARITSIVEDYGISKYAPVIATLLKNPTLILPQ